VPAIAVGADAGTLSALAVHYLSQDVALSATFYRHSIDVWGID
jgi:hypothetical protein